ncbi:MAG: hypothetical protein M1561_00025 [Gammaproteobacteria bacterium]|nr:hypothetical protein [Gammaproteobacteria bacterium]
MKHFAFYVLIFLCGFFLIFPVVPASQAVVDKARPEFLFVHNAKDAVIEKSGDSGYYTMTLQHPDKYLTYFSDRPYRIAGLMRLSKFIADWVNNVSDYNAVNPNAVISAVLKKGVMQQENVNYPVQLMGVSFYKDTETLSFKIKFLTSVGKTTPTKLEHVTVFIDDLDLYGIYQAGPLGACGNCL